MKTFEKLKQAVRDRNWPSGDPESLVIPHDKMVVEGLIALQQVIECLQFNNTLLVPACGTLFRTGNSVFDAPRGNINALHVVDRVTKCGKEDALQPLDWGGRILYRQVDYTKLQEITMQQGVKLSSIGVVLGLDCDRLQRKFPKATDDEYPGVDKLPVGFHYSQSGTNSPYGRAYQGVWALNHLRVYVFPWIQSTETIVVEWDGIKREWEDGDVVDDDPLIEKAVALYVEFNHAKLYDNDFERSNYLEGEYLRVLQQLELDCREEGRIRKGQGSQSRAGNIEMKSGCPEVLPPVFSPAGTSLVLYPTEVALESGVEGGTSHYTAHDKDPNISSPLYKYPFMVVDGMTVKAVSVDTQGCESAVAHSGYARYGDGKFWRMCSQIDRSGTWHEFESNNGPDWNWGLEFPVEELTEIKHLEIYECDADGIWRSGQTWSTKQEIQPSTDVYLKPWPLVIYNDGVQVNFSYINSLGFFREGITWELYGNVGGESPAPHYLLRVFTDKDERPVEVLIPGPTCDEQCCEDSCGNSVLTDDFLIITLNLDPGTCDELPDSTTSGPTS